MGACRASKSKVNDRKELENEVISMQIRIAIRQLIMCVASEDLERRME